MNEVGVLAAQPREIPLERGEGGALWRSLLSPLPGQRALELSPTTKSLFRALVGAGLKVQPGFSLRDEGADAYDLILEDRSGGRSYRRPSAILPLLAPGGRWVVALEAQRWVGLAGHTILKRARKEGFGRIQTFYAHPSLRSPQMLVPLDGRGPFLYFMSVAIRNRTVGHRIKAAGIRLLYSLGLHRVFLPNVIVIARRER